MPKPCDCGGQKTKTKCYNWCSSLQPDPIELDNLPDAFCAGDKPIVTMKEWTEAVVDNIKNLLRSC